MNHVLLWFVDTLISPTDQRLQFQTLFALTCHFKPGNILFRPLSSLALCPNRVFLGHLQCQRFFPGMIILNRHSQHILPDNWSKPLSIYPPHSPSLVVSKKRERNMQFQMYRWLTLKCQCSAKFRGCYRINGNVKVSKTRYAWWWSPRKKADTHCF